MNIKDRRRHLRHEAKVGATILTSDIKCKAAMFDISEGGVGVISENAIKPGSKVLVSLELEGNYVLHGTVIWSSHIHEGKENYYKMGIETDGIILKDIKAISFPDKAELVAQILSQIKKQKIRVVESYDH